MKQPKKVFNFDYLRSPNTLTYRWFKYVFLVFLVLQGSVSFCQTLTLSQSVSNASPVEFEAFDYIINISCNSTTGDCLDAQMTGTLPDAIDYVSFSDPLPLGVSSATYDPVTRQYVIAFDQGDGNDLAQGSSIQIRLQVLFPWRTIATSSATNTVTASSSNTPSVNASATATVANGSTSVGDFMDLKLPQTYEVISDIEVYWRVYVGNRGFTDIDNYEMIDRLPANTTFTQVRTPEFPNINSPGVIYYELSNNPGVWNFWFNFNLNLREEYDAIDLGLAPGVTVTAIRMTLGTIPGGGLYNGLRYDQYDASLIIYAQIASGLADGTVITNCVDYAGTIGGSAASDNACTDNIIDSSIALREPSGYHGYYDINTGDPISLLNIGDTAQIEFTYYSEAVMVEDIMGAVITMVVPAGMSYVPGSWGYGWDCTDPMDGQEPEIQTGTLPDGRDFVRVVYDNDFSNVFNMEADGYWQGCEYVIKVVADAGATPGDVFSYQYFNATEPHFTDCGTLDTDNYLNGYAPTYCSTTTDIRLILPPSSAGVISEKEVIGTLDASYSKYPATGTTVPGGLSNYRITLTNPNATPIDNIRLYDILPFVGDSEVLDASTNRFSQWQPNLASQITTPAGVTVYYSTESNPCRDDLAGSNPTPFPNPCDAPGWTTIAPPDITDVRALYFEMWGVTLNQNESVTIDFEMRAPVNAPTAGEIAWNSFAFVADNATTGSELLPTEPIKVGVEIVEGTVPIAGDFIWDDVNGNGLQDVGEPGIDGVRVALYEDTNGNGIAEPGAGDNEYTWSISANGGQYIFSDFPFGDYFLVFSDFPVGYIGTISDVGSNDGLDSDGVITMVSTYTGTTDRNDIDLGLYQFDCSTEVIIPEVELSKSGETNTEYFDANGLISNISNYDLEVTTSGTSLLGYDYANANYGLTGSLYNTDPSDPIPNFEGMTIGPFNESGDVTLNFARPTLSLSFSIKWLSQQILGEYGGSLPTGEEFLDNFTADVPINTSYTPYNSPLDTDTDGNIDGPTTAWDGSQITTFYADGRGEVVITALSTPFTSITFSHTQIGTPGGFPIYEISYCPAPVLWECTSDILQNPEFESGFTDWVDWGNSSLSTDAYVNDNAMLINGGAGGRAQALSVTPGETYRLSFYSKKTGSEAASAGFNVKDVNNNNIYSIARGVYENVYEYHSITMSIPENGDRLEVYAWKNAGTGTAYYDAFCLELVNDICGGGGEPNSDGDSICNRYDIDDDNDGIRDIDESMCNGNWQELVQWTHNTPGNTGDSEILYPAGIASAGLEGYGSGITATLTTTYVLMAGVDQLDLSSAILDDDYLEYSITTQADISAIYLHQFRMTKHGLASLGEVGNYGYDFSILVSDDGFATSSIISDIFTVDDNVDPDFVSFFQEVDDNYYYLRPNTTYTFRCYFYNKTTDSSVRALYDDFTIEAQVCDQVWDTDGDGYPNSEDLDSDNDGLTDLTESGHPVADSNNDGIVDGADTGSGINGLLDALETTADNGSINYTISDSESTGDGIYDPYELDSDGDGCFDTIESEISNLDPDDDGTAGTGVPSVNSNGLVIGATYPLPINNYWQDVLYNFCQACRVARTNPHIMYYRAKR